MASGGLGNLTVDLLLETADWLAGLNKADYQAQKFADAIGKKFDDMGKEVLSSFKKMAAGAVAAFSVHAAYDFIHSAVEVADKLDDISAKTGDSVKALAELSTYAGMAGTSIESLGGVLVKFDVALVKSREDSASAQAAIFKALDISTIGKTSEQVLGELAKLFAKMPEGPERTALAIDLLGKKGAEMIPVMIAMAGASDTLKEANKAHGEVVQRLADQYRDLEDAQTVASVKSATFASLLAEQFLPYVTKLVEQWNALTDATTGLGPAMEVAVNVFKGLVIAVDVLVTGLIAAGTLIVATAVALYKLNQGDTAGAFQTMSAALADVDKQGRAFEARLEALVNPLDRVQKKTEDAADAQLKLAAALKATAEAKAAEEARKKAERDAEAAAKKAEEAYQGLAKSISEKIALDMAEANSTTALTETEKLVLKIKTDLKDGTVKLTAARQADIAVALKALEVAGKMKAAHEAEIKNLAYLRERQEALNKVRDANLAIVDDTLNKWQDQEKDAEFAITLLGKTKAEQEALTEARRVDLEVKAKIAALDKSVGMEEYERLAKEITAEGELHKARMAGYAATTVASHNATKELEAQWGDTYNALQDMGHNAFENLFEGTGHGWQKMLDGMAQDFKKLLVDFVYKQFVKPIILNLLAQSEGGLGQYASSLMGQSGSGGSLSSLMSGASSLYDTAAGWFGGGAADATGMGAMAGNTGFSAGGAGMGAGLMTAGAGIIGGIAGYGVANLYGAGARGQQAAANYGALGASIGTAILPGIGTAIGWALGTVAGIATDPSPDAMRSATFGASAGAKGQTPYQYTSALGTFGISDTKWFSDKDMGDSLKQFMASMQALDTAIASVASADEIGKLRARLATFSKEYEFGMEHMDTAGLGDILKDRLRIVIEEIAPEVTGFFDAFTGGIEDLGTVMQGYLSIRGAITSYDPEEVVKGIEAENEARSSQMEMYQRSIGGLNDLVAAWDGSAASTTAVTDSLGAFQAATVQMIMAIDAAAAAMHAMFTDTADAIRQSTMSDQERYQFLQERSSGLFDQLLTETDPAKIQELATRINSDINSAWSLLSDDQKQTLSSSFLERLDALDQAVADKMTGLKDVVTDDSQSMMSTISARLDEIFKSADASAATNAQAAAVQLEAANTPIQVVVNVNGDGGIVTSSG